MSDTAKPVVWLAHLSGLNRVAGDQLAGLGYDVRSFEGERPSQPEAKPSTPFRDGSERPPVYAKQTGKFGDRTQPIQSSGLLEMPVASPSPMTHGADRVEMMCESLRDISSGITLHIGVLNVNFQGSGEVGL